MSELSADELEAARNFARSLSAAQRAVLESIAAAGGALEWMDAIERANARLMQFGRAQSRLSFTTIRALIERGLLICRPPAMAGARSTYELTALARVAMRLNAPSEPRCIAKAEG